MSVRLKWEGDRIIREVNAAIPRRVRRAAEAGARAVASEAPVDTGTLRDSVHVEAGAVPGQFLIVADAPHAGWVNGGTRNRAANPFFQRGLYKARAEMAAIMAGQGDGLIARLGSGVATAAGRVFGLK